MLLKLNTHTHSQWSAAPLPGIHPLARHVNVHGKTQNVHSSTIPNRTEVECPDVRIKITVDSPMQHYTAMRMHHLSTAWMSLTMLSERS